jgi:hypothetical protein
LGLTLLKPLAAKEEVVTSPFLRLSVALYDCHTSNSESQNKEHVSVRFPTALCLFLLFVAMVTGPILLI